MQFQISMNIQRAIGSEGDRVFGWRFLFLAAILAHEMQCAGGTAQNRLYDVLSRSFSGLDPGALVLVKDCRQAADACFKMDAAFDFVLDDDIFALIFANLWLMFHAGHSLERMIIIGKTTYIRLF
jgi:hypothetical protein